MAILLRLVAWLAILFVLVGANVRKVSDLIEDWVWCKNIGVCMGQNLKHEKPYEC